MGNGSKTRKAKKELTTYQITFIIVFIIFSLVMLFLAIIPAIKWLKLDKNAIQVHYKTDDNGVDSFQYDGKTYYKIDEWPLYSSLFFMIEKEFQGRAMGTHNVLYTIAGDSEKSVIIGENPSYYNVYSYKYSELPVDGKVTGVYLDLRQRRSVEYQHYTPIKEEYLCGEHEVELFQRLWTERHKNNPVKFEDGNSVDYPVSLNVRFCFDACPIPDDRAYYQLSYQKGKWYFIETEYEHISNGKTRMIYWGYLIDDSEISEYLTTFVQYEKTLE